MTSFCDVCHGEAAVVGPFCVRCSNALLDAEAKRLLTLQKVGREDLEVGEVVEATLSFWKVVGLGL